MIPVFFILCKNNPSDAIVFAPSSVFRSFLILHAWRFNWSFETMKNGCPKNNLFSVLNIKSSIGFSVFLWDVQVSESSRSYFYPTPIIDLIDTFQFLNNFLFRVITIQSISDFPRIHSPVVAEPNSTKDSISFG